MSDQIDFLWRQLPNLLWGFGGSRPGGLVLSILLSGGAIAAGLLLAIPVSFGRHSKHRVVRTLCERAVWLIRGIPLIVLLVLIFQFLGTSQFFGIGFSAFWSAAVTLTLFAAAYQSDILTGGITAVPEQLREQAQLLGARRWTLARTVTLPYALRSTRPALATQAITVFKDSSVVVVLGVSELTTNARIALGGDVSNTPYWVATYLLVGALYWCVAFALGRLVERNDSGIVRTADARV